MIEQQKIRELRVELSPSHTHTQSGDVMRTLELIRANLAKINAIVHHQTDASSSELEGLLSEISHIFRTGKFSKLVLPILKALESEDSEKWKNSRINDTNMALTAEYFEQLPKSTTEITQKEGLPAPAVRIREIVLLSIYGITMEDIGSAFHKLKNSE